MKNIVAFGASSSSQSINKQLAEWAARQIKEAQVNLLDLNDYEMPIYSIDREKEGGIPVEAKNFKKLINEADGVIISFAEHNGSYSAAFKNILDWISRLEKPIWADKPMLILSTSPGPRGGQSVLTTAVNSFPFQGGVVAGSFSLPSFNKHFNTDQGISEASLNAVFIKQLGQFERLIAENLKEVA